MVCHEPEGRKQNNPKRNDVKVRLRTDEADITTALMNIAPSMIIYHGQKLVRQGD